jgi:hypothetical protein
VAAELQRTVARAQSVRMEFSGPIVAELSLDEFAALGENRRWRVELPAGSLRVLG